MLGNDDLQRFAATLRGELIQPADPGYDAARALYNGMIDKRPRLIARCADTADVIAAVNFGRAQGLALAVRGGGHNGAGFAACDDGLVIDLSRLRGVRVDPVKRTIRAAGGCTLGDIDHAAHAFGLAIPTGIMSTTGIAGLALGGGHGYLSRAYGLTIDNLVEADVVLADGRFLTASADENAELFWALRGGGGNFGVVTSFLFQAHPVTSVYGGPIFWRIEDAGQVMRAYRDFLSSAPRRLSPFLGLQKVPATAPFPDELWGVPTCALVSCYAGEAAEGAKAMRPLLDTLPPPVIDWMSEMPYPQLQTLFDGLMPAGLQWYWAGDFVDELSDEAIEVHLGQALDIPGAMSTMHLYPIDGAVRDVAPDATAWRHRDTTWSMVIAGIDPDPAMAGELKTWARGYWAAVHPFNRRGGYVNFMMDDQGHERIEDSYGDNHPRLARAKAQFDPGNLFRLNHNIAPAGTPPSR